MKNLLDETPFYNSTNSYDSTMGICMMETSSPIKRTNSISNIITIIDDSNSYNSKQTKISSEIKNDEILDNKDNNINNVINIYRKEDDTSCRKILKNYCGWFDGKYFIGISIMILSLVLIVYLNIYLQKINEFQIMFSQLINNKINTLNINSFNDATSHVSSLANSINNISNILYTDNEQLNRLLKDLEKIINSKNLTR